MMMDGIVNEFPGYSFEFGEDGKPHNMYRGVDLGFGGYVYAEPGIYTNVALLDVESMHPNSVIALNLFGSYTPRFAELLKARLLIKHGNYEEAASLFDGRLSPYLTDEKSAGALSQALKIAINSVYGLTSASFENVFADPRNKNNIVALRGALFMKTLQDEVTARGYKVVHIKTDSIKIPNADDKIIDFAVNFAKQYGYTFDHESTYERMCLINDAVYIAKVASGKHAGTWQAVGAQFQQPFVFKKLFSGEPIEFTDLCETKAVSTAIFLDMNESLPEGEHDYHFVGKVGSFVPIQPGKGGGVLYRQQGEKYNAVVGSTGYRWLEAEDVINAKKQDDVDYSYHSHLVDEAVAAISQFGDCDAFINGVSPEYPWCQQACESCDAKQTCENSLPF